MRFSFDVFQLLFLHLLIHLGLPTLTKSRLVNVTVDDTEADPLTGAAFTYSGTWSQGEHCSQCTIKLDPSQVHNETWHDATFDPHQHGESTVQTARLTFNGSSFPKCYRPKGG